jgi:hypothetical protein
MGGRAPHLFFLLHFTGAGDETSSHHQEAKAQPMRRTQNIPSSERGQIWQALKFGQSSHLFFLPHPQDSTDL